GLLNAGTDLRVGDNDAAGTGTGPTLPVSNFNLTGGTLNATFDDVIIGRFLTGTGNGKGTFTMDAGTVTANTVSLAVSAGTTASATTGTLTQRGGTFTVANGFTEGAGVSGLFVDHGTFTVQ